MPFGLKIILMLHILTFIAFIFQLFNFELLLDSFNQSQLPVILSIIWFFVFQGINLFLVMSILHRLKAGFYAYMFYGAIRIIMLLWDVLHIFMEPVRRPLATNVLYGIYTVALFIVLVMSLYIYSQRSYFNRSINI